VAAYKIIGQGGAFRVHRSNAPVGQKPELYKRLEAVAYTQHQPVTFEKKVVHRFGKSFSPEKGGYELTRTVRLIAAGKAAGSTSICASLIAFSSARADSSSAFAF
jgi:hypothetical protein